jgi:hypothetical protein
MSARARTVVNRYLAVTALLNLGLAVGVCWLCRAMTYAYGVVYGGHPKEFAALTISSLKYGCWPYVVGGVAACVAMMASRGCCRPRALLCAVFLILGADALAMYMILVGFVLPFISTP